MNVPQRPSGRTARWLADKQFSRRMKIVLIMLGVLVLFSFLYSAKLGIGGMIVLLVLFRVVTGFLRDEAGTARKREKQAIRGAKAEDSVADVLGELSDDYRVFHDVSTDKGDIDHVVISRQGAVFVIETKAHGGKVTFQGQSILINGKPPEKNFVGQTLKNAYWVKDRIKEQTGREVWVNAILVFANAFVDFHAPIRGVKVMNRKFLLREIQNERVKRPAPEIWGQVEF